MMSPPPAPPGPIMAPVPGPGYYNQPQMHPGPMPYVSGMSYGVPPPGALVVRPGDPRIGE